MFGIQTSELVVIALVAILVLGPEKVPELFHRAGKFVSRLQRSADDMWTTIQTEVEQARKPIEDAGRSVDEAGRKLIEPDTKDGDDGEQP